MYPAHAKRLSTCTTMSPIQTRPTGTLRRGWKTRGSRLTPSQQTRAFPKWTLEAEWWRSTLRSGALALCQRTASTWPSRTTEAACRSSPSGFSTGSVLGSSPTGRCSRRRYQALRAPPSWLRGEFAFPTQRRWTCPSSSTATGMESGWCRLAAVCAKPEMRRWKTELFVEVRFPPMLFQDAFTVFFEQIYQKETAQSLLLSWQNKNTVI